jgi:dsRNA-specific ribonuclease
VQLRGVPYGSGEGRSKKAAEQGAAREAWKRLQHEASAAVGDGGNNA